MKILVLCDAAGAWSERVVSHFVMVDARGYVAEDAEEFIELCPPRSAARSQEQPEYDALVVLASRLIEAPVRAIRAASSTALVVVDDASLGDEATSALLDAGADDVLSVNRLSQLPSRIRSSVRRGRGHSQSIIACGPLSLNLAQRTLSSGESLIPLTGKEFQMMELFMLRKGSCITKEAFLSSMYGGRDEPELKIVDVFLCKIRRKIAEATGGKNYIQTIWGRGYTLVDNPVALRRAESLMEESDERFVA